MNQRVVRTYSRLPKFGTLSVLGPSCALLVLMMGVPLPPIVQFLRDDARLTDAEARTVRAGQLARELRSLDETESPAALRSASAGLRALLPADLDPVRVHAATRRAAQLTGVDLILIRIGAERSHGHVVAGEGVHGLALTITGRATPGALFGLVQALRRGGAPLAVRAAILRPESGQATTARQDFELQLELFRRGAPTEAETLEMEFPQ